MGRLSPSFRRLCLASALSNVADGIFQVALPLLAVTVTRSPALVAGVALAQRLPWLVMALPAGALADRLDRRRTMVRVEVLRVGVMAGLALMVVTGSTTMPALYGAALVLGVGETLFDTAAQSILPSLVERHQLSAANGRLQAVELTTNLFLGPPLGGLLAAAAIAGAFAVSSGAYLVAALCLASIAGSFWAQRAGPRPRLGRDIGEGLLFVWRSPVLRALGLTLGVMNLAFTASLSVFVLYAVDPGPMGLSEAGYGALLASGALGGVAASATSPALERSLGRRGCLAGAVVTIAVSLAVPALTPAVVANGAAFFTASFAAVVWNVITVSLRQRITPGHLLGRMNAAYRLFGWGGMPIGAALGGAVGQWWGLRTTFVVAALVHIPLLAGFRAVTDQAIEEAELGVPGG